MESSIISIVVPVYNAQDYIERCISSIQGQTFQNYEVYLIDDGSQDDSAKIIKSCIKNDERFHYVYKTNEGQAIARNLGIELASGRYITFVDSDDFIADNYLEIMYESIIDSQADLVVCEFERIYHNKVSYNSLSEFDVRNCRFPAVWGKLFRLDWIIEKNIRFPDKLWYEDLCFFAQYITLVDHIKIIHKPLYKYIQNPNSTMYTYSNKINDIFSVFSILENKKIDPNILEFIKIYHGLVGTVYRASFKDDFSVDTIRSIVLHTVKNDKLWIKNDGIKQLSFIFKGYLWALSKRLYFLIFLMMRVFHSRIVL